MENISRSLKCHKNSIKDLYYWGKPILGVKITPSSTQEYFRYVNPLLESEYTLRCIQRLRLSVYKSPELNSHQTCLIKVFALFFPLGGKIIPCLEQRMEWSAVVGNGFYVNTFPRGFICFVYIIL